MKRLSYFDMAKGIGIILVILGHTYSEGIIKTWLYSFHIPLFFIVSGCLIRYKISIENNLKNIIFTRVKSIMVPYFAFSMIAILVRFVLSKFSIAFALDDLIHTVEFRGIGAMWFLPCIFLSECIFMIIKKKINKNSLTILISIVIFLIPIILANNEYNDFIMGILRSFIGVGFIALGYYSYDFISKANLSYLLLIPLICISAIVSHFNGLTDLYGLIFNNVLGYMFCSTLGSISLLLFLKRIKNVKVLSYWGSNSLIIMCSHLQIIRVFEALHIDTNNFFIGLAILIFILAVEYVIITIINKYMPFLLGKSIKNNSNKLNMQYTQ